MNKKGVFSADFSISLAIFIFYLAWFIIFVRPIFSQGNTLSPLGDTIEENLIPSCSWDVQRLPIIIASPGIHELYGISSEFNYGWNSTNSGFYNNGPFCIINNKIYFLTNLSTGLNINFLAHTDTFYNNSWQFIEADFSETLSNVNDLKITFSNSVPNNFNYKGIERIKDFEYSLNTGPLTPIDSNFTDYNFMSTHQTNFGALTTLHGVFAKNTRMIGEIKKQTTSNEHNLIIKMDLDEYDNYFSNNVFSGTIKVL